MPDHFVSAFGFCRLAAARVAPMALLLLGTSALAAPRHHKVAPVDHPARAGGPQAVQASNAEAITVRAAANLSNGVSNTTPGGGLMPPQTAPRSQSGITRDYIAKRSPTANVQALIGQLPGVVTVSQDPAGVTGDHLNIHGFNEQQIGYLLEGAPVVAPVAYTPYTSQMIDAENLGSVNVVEGASDIDAPIFNALGGQITMKAMAPSQNAGIHLGLTGGTKSLNKEFIRVNSGEIGHSGVRAFASFSHLGANNWRGPGDTHRNHVDVHILKEWGRGSSAGVFFAYNHTQYTKFLLPTLANWNKYGISNNLSAAYYPGNATYYKLNVTQNNMTTVIAPVKLRLTEGLDLNITPYWVDIWGPSDSGSNVNNHGAYLGTQAIGLLDLPNTVGNSATVQYVDPAEQRMGGLNTSIAWTKGNNTLTLGYWYSYLQHQEYGTASIVGANGLSESQMGKYPIYTSLGLPLAQFNINFKQQTNTIYLADVIKFFDNRLLLSGGFRAAMVSRTVTNLLPGADPYKNGGSYFEPLPQIAASYRITPHDQIFINGSTAFRAPTSVQAYIQIFSNNSPTPSAQPPTSLKSEFSIGEQIGYRHTGPVNVSVSLFNYNLTNHQVTSSTYLPGTTTLVSLPLNVGGETGRGVSGEVSTGYWHHFSLYASGQYLHVTTDNNFLVGTDYLPTAGKIAVQSPKWTGSIGLHYDNSRFFSNFDLRYVDSQYSTIMDNQSMPSYIVADTTFGYRLPKLAFLKHPTLQLNLMNIGNNHYLSGVSGLTGTAVAMRGIHGSMISASQPTYVVGAGFATFVSLTTDL